ncbi:MAG TPA: ATP-binding cassette domain-containing protein [Allocoleopsis sp.]
MIRIEGVSHSFGERCILNHLNLDLTEHRIGIVGSNGSGKSSFVRLLNGLLIPDRGDVWVDGLNTRKDAKAIRRKVGFVFQNPDNQIVFPIVEEDLAFGLKNLKLSRAETADRIHTILDRYQLSHLRQHPTHLLSGGEKQLLAIASVLVMQPQYVIFDEPTTLLDLRNRNRIQRALWELEQPIIVVSHDLELLNSFDRILVFEAGNVIADDHPAKALPYYVELMS